MSALTQAIPSMFHRRLLLLMTLIVGGTLVLLGQTARLTIVQGAHNRAEAEQVLSRRTLVATVRGSIFDRKGRALAEDRPCFDISVDYQVIIGEWAYQKARAIARRDAGKQWAKLSFDEREARVAQYREPFDGRLNQLWRTLADIGGIDAAELEERKRSIIDSVQMIRRNRFAEQERRRALEAQGPLELTTQLDYSVREEFTPHPILRAVTDEVAFAVRKLTDDLPGVHVTPSKARWYFSQGMDVELARDTLPGPMRSAAKTKIHVDSLVPHILGGMGQVDSRDVDTGTGRPFNRSDGSTDLWGYLPGDLKGVGGVEQAEEWRLRGRRGQVVRRRDTNEEHRDAYVPGQDVQLTIDVALEARIRAIMDPAFGLMKVQPFHRNKDLPEGTPLFGAVVVLEVDTGEVIAAVSTPAPPPRIPGQPYPDLSKDPTAPFIDRALTGRYPPGSTLKPIIYCIAAKEKVIGWDQVIACHGALDPAKPNLYQCWIAKQYNGRTHGDMTPAQALQHSCNVYFNSCGKLLGPDRLVQGLHQWGFGEYPGIGLLSESRGMLAEVQPTGRTNLQIWDAIHMGIGQGRIAATPLQVAAAHAALARGGTWLSPVLMRTRASRQESRELNLPPRVIANVMQGMYDSINVEGGTGAVLSLDAGREKIINVPDLVVRGKTGTADAPLQFQDTNGNGRRDADEPILRDGDHSWYVVHAGRKGAERSGFIVVVMAEYGGSGGKVSGPVCNQVLHALRAQGYL